MPDPVIIVDANGTEHEFPAGFDPKKAGAIVRYRTQPPPSAEDFTPKQAEGTGIVGALTAFAKSLDPRPLASLAANTVLASQRDPTAVGRAGLGVARQVLGQQGQQFAKAGERGMDALRQAGSGNAQGAVQSGTEAAFRALAGALPVVGPAAAKAGERIGSGDVAGGVGESAALLAPFAAGPTLRLAGRVAPAVGRGASAVGHGAGIIAKEAAPTVGAGIGASVAGAPGAMIGGIAGRSAARLIGRMIRKAPVAAETPVPPLATHGPEIEASLKGSVWPEPVLHGPEPSPNFGGVLRPKTTVQDALLDALSEPQKPTPPARITTPPQAELPAGYTPRTTVPKPKAPAAAPPAKPQPSATIGKRNYFLKSSAEPAPIREAPAKVDLSLDDLPASWRSRVGQPLIAPGGSTGQQIAADTADVLSEKGFSPADAIDAVTRDPNLSPGQRLTLQSALLKMLGGQ